MGDMWRSQHMQLVQLIVQNDAAHAVVTKLGQIGLLQFRDLNAGTSFYKRSFVEEVRKCDDLQRILRTISEEYEESDITLADKDDALSIKMTLDDVEVKIKAVEHELQDLKSQQEVSSGRARRNSASPSMDIACSPSGQPRPFVSPSIVHVHCHVHCAVPSLASLPPPPYGRGAEHRACGLVAAASGQKRQRPSRAETQSNRIRPDLKLRL